MEVAAGLHSLSGHDLASQAGWETEKEMPFPVQKFPVNSLDVP